MQFLFAPFWGAWSDRIGRKPVLRIAAALFAVSAVASALAPDFISLVIARMIGGLGGFFLPIAFGLLLDFTGVLTAPYMLLFVSVASFLIGSLFRLNFSFADSVHRAHGDRRHRFRQASARRDAAVL